MTRFILYVKKYNDNNNNDDNKKYIYLQILKTRIQRNNLVPNHEVSRVVSRTIAQHKKQVNGLIETIENEFKSINHDIERQIVDACLELRNTLNVQENSLSCILEDRNSVNEKFIFIVRNDI